MNTHCCDALWVYMLVCAWLFCGMLGSAQDLYGMITVHTESRIISQPFPTGDRTISSHTHPNYHCTVCDSGAPTEQCFAELGVCARLSNTSVTITGPDGTPLSTVHFDASCTPRYLQRLESPGLHFGVVCQNSCFQIATIMESTVRFHEYPCNPTEGIVSGIIVEGNADDGSGKVVYHVEADDDELYQSRPLDGGGVTFITPNTDCTAFISLFPLYFQDKFLLWCNKNTQKHLYVVDVYEHIHPESTPSISSSSTPLPSPDGLTFITVDNTTLFIYRADAESSIPGARDFGTRIIFHTYLDNNTVVLYLEGQNQVLVNVDVFIYNSGTQGITTLSLASTTATVHKLITPEVYATWNKPRSLYNLLLYDTSSGQLLRTIPNLLERPIDVFFQQGPIPPTPSPVISSSPGLDSTVSPTSSSPPSFPPSAYPVTTQLPTTPIGHPTEPTTVKSTVLTEGHIYIVVGLVFTLFLVAAGIIVFAASWYFKRLSNKWFCQKTTGPVEQATPDDGNSSGRETATPTPTNSWSTSSLKSFNEPVSGSVSGYGSYNGPFTRPIPESSNC